jgi:fructose-1,6-bisphosphatase-3
MWEVVRELAARDEGTLSEHLGRVERALGGRAGVAATFMSDVHGDLPAFDHLVRTAFGETRALVEDALGPECPEGERAAVATLLAYPEAAGQAGVDGRALDDLAARVRAHGTGGFHLVGDVWDRGPAGDGVMDVLMGVPGADVQWGNHDVCWMGAAAGDPVCVATCLRNNLKYGNTAQFEEGYGIDLEPLRAFAARTYADDGTLPPLMKAMSALLFKAEGQAVLRHPAWGMSDRLLWGAMDPARASVAVYGSTQQLKTRDFPTWDAADPYAYTAAERELMAGLVAAFCSSGRLQGQVQWLYDHGSVYRAVELPGGACALALHGCVPLTEEGGLATVVDDEGTGRAGRELLDWTDELCRRAWEGRAQADLDWMGQLWCGWRSTFAGRVVKTFERTYIEDQATWKEPEDPYYALTREDAAPCELVLTELGCDPARSFLVNGHTPVKLPKGERPVRGGGLRLVIDGGLCSAYRKTTGIAGYALLCDADGSLRLASFGEFPGEEAVRTSGAQAPREVERLA